MIKLIVWSLVQILVLFKFGFSHYLVGFLTKTSFIVRFFLCLVVPYFDDVSDCSVMTDFSFFWFLNFLISVFSDINVLCCLWYWCCFWFLCCYLFQGSLVHKFACFSFFCCQYVIIFLLLLISMLRLIHPQLWFLFFLMSVLLFFH